MLDSIRRRTNGLVSTFIILATAVVMTMWGVGKMGGDDGGAGGGTAAWVNGEAISKREFAQEYEMKLQQYQQMLGNQFDDRFLAALQIPQRTLDELIQFKLLAQQAEKLGIRVPDEELADFIRSVPSFQKDGKFSRELYEKIPNRGIEEKRQREKLRLAKFQRFLADRVRLTPVELKHSYDLRETKADLYYAKVDFNEMANRNKPSAHDVAEYLKAPASAGELQKYYEAHKKDFSQPAAVSLRQIRVGIPFQAPAAKKAEAKKKIDEIAKGLTSDNFAATAKKSSDDEFAKKGGLVGWVNRGTLEKPLEDALEKLEPGKVSAPIETTFGYYILQVGDRRPEVVKPLNDVKNTIAEKLVTESQKKKFIEAKKGEFDKMLAEGKSIEPELKKLKIDVKKTGPFSLGTGFVPNIGQADAIVDAIFDMTPARPLPKKLFAFNDNYYFVKLISIERPKDADFAKQKDVVEKAVLTSLQGELLNQWITALQKNSTVKTELKFRNDGAGVPQLPSE